MTHPQPDQPEMGHNGGPPLDPPHTPIWGTGKIGTFFSWQASHAEAWANVPYDNTAIRRVTKATALGLTYAEYTLEILERGRFLQIKDTDRIAQILAKRA